MFDEETKDDFLGSVVAFGLSGPAFADALGVAKGVDPQAVAKQGSVERTLIAGEDVLLGDVITTGPTGLVQIIFVDNTKLVIGPDSV